MYVAPELAAGARAKLLARGAVGLHPSGAEFATMARDLDWQLVEPQKRCTWASSANPLQRWDSERGFGSSVKATHSC
jgi:hypothetical protein